MYLGVPLPFEFLYLPFRSETPRATLRGMITGELIRFITHSSDYLDYLRIAKLFWFRLLLASTYQHSLLSFSKWTIVCRLAVGRVECVPAFCC